MIGDLVVGAAIVLMVLGSIYSIRRDRRNGIACGGCGGSCSCGKRRGGNPINVTIDETADSKHRSQTGLRPHLPSRTASSIDAY